MVMFFTAIDKKLNVEKLYKLGLNWILDALLSLVWLGDTKMLSFSSEEERAAI